MTESEGELTEGELDGAVQALAKDSFYRVLADRLRRRVLFSLLKTDESTTDELAELLYGWASTTGEQASYNQIRTELHHVHLPKLAATDLIEFEPETETIKRTELLEEVRVLIRRSIEAEQVDRSQKS